VPLSVAIDAPARDTTGRFEATVDIHSPDAAVAAWSLSLRAQGCRLAGATHQRTPVADLWDSPPGIRHLGYAVTATVSEGAVAAAILSVTEDVVLPRARTPVMRVTVEADVPASGCASCTLELGDGLSWYRGHALDEVVVVDGRAYRPEATRATVEVCAP
jgi:hypothetical protein